MLSDIEFIHADCFDWMKARESDSVTAIVTDPPYGLVEYTAVELEKKNLGKGGIWRMPQRIGGCERRPVPRFSIINDSEKARQDLYRFFREWGDLAYDVLVPGGHVILASTVLLSDIVSSALRDSGLQRRGELMRSVSTLRGGDRPKLAEEEFPGVSVMPKGLVEPWELFRKPLSERTVADNLRKWHAGGLRRRPDGSPACDYITSGKPTKSERAISSHPSLKPQDFMRKVAWMSLPLGKGLVLDPFAGSGSTLAACKAIGYDVIGIEKDNGY